MKESVFRFKYFAVRHDGVALKVGTDGVLLGVLADVDGVVSVLDVGVGSGLISLIVAQRNRCAHVLGIDIDPKAVQQATDNFASSPWAGRLTAQKADFRYFDHGALFDLILSNPPFFPTAVRSMSPARRLARVSETLSFEQLACRAASNLAPGGVFQLILPFAYADDSVFTAWQYGLRLLKRIDIRTKRSKPPKRAILSFTNSPVAQSRYASNELILLGEDGSPTSEYRALTSDFYV